MKKLALGILCFMMTLNSFAASTGKADLIQVFDEYQYSVTVDWDQKDEKKLAELTDDFYKNIDKLTLEKGVDVKELEALVNSRTQNAKVAEALKVKLSLLGKNPSRAELIKFMKEESNQMYARGSSWNGDTPYIAGTIIFFVAIVAYAIWFHATHECVSWEEQADEVNCTRSSGIDNYGDIYYYGPEHCKTEYVQVCTQWVKK